jgi:hypothetical protein
LEFVSILIITPIHDIHVDKNWIANRRKQQRYQQQDQLRILATAAVITAVATAFALLGLHIQILCLQFVYVLLNNLRISTHFELAGKIWHRICVLENGSSYGRNLDDSLNNYTTKVLMSVSQD